MTTGAAHVTTGAAHTSCDPPRAVSSDGPQMGKQFQKLNVTPSALEGSAGEGSAGRCPWAEARLGAAGSPGGKWDSDMCMIRWGHVLKGPSGVPRRLGFVWRLQGVV